MVAIMRPFGEIVSTPLKFKHTSSDINSLVKLIKSIEGESRIVMEHTGYYEVLPINFPKQIFSLVPLTQSQGFLTIPS